MSIVALKVYAKSGRMKLEIALAKGKKSHDKRQAIKDRDIQRDQLKTVRELEGSMSQKANGTLFYGLGSVRSVLYTILFALKGHLLPIITAVVLVYLTKPLQQLLKSLGLPDKTSALLISLSLFSIIFFIVFHAIPLLMSELSRIILQLPENVETTYNLINELLAPYDITIETDNIQKALSQSLNLSGL